MKIASLLLIAAGAIAASVFVGSGDLPPGEMKRAILVDLRLPRACLGFLTGAALAAAGVTFQGLFRNALADPFVTGVSGGAALGAVVALTLGLRQYVFGLAPAALAAFVGALATVAVVHRLAHVRGRVPVGTLLLAGFAVQALTSALVSILILFHTKDWNEVLRWLMGSLSDARWLKVQLLIPFVVVAYAVMRFYARDLNVMLMGEESAQQLGVDVERTKRRLMAAGAIATAAAVAACGIVGFVGLIVPHIARKLVGPDHRNLLPVTALAGGALVVIADLAARWAMPPAGLPIGAVTALLGAPFFLYMMRRRGVRA